MARKRLPIGLQDFRSIIEGDYKYIDKTRYIHILEYKLNKSAKAALEQIKQKRYYEAYWNVGKPVVGVGVNFSSKTKNIKDWVAEVLVG